MEFVRKKKEALPVLAICYDFDKTLSPDDMQAQGYIQSVGYDVAEFWKASNRLARENEMDSNLAYMWLMVQESEGRMVFRTERTFVNPVIREAKRQAAEFAQKQITERIVAIAIDVQASDLEGIIHLFFRCGRKVCDQ